MFARDVETVLSAESIAVRLAASVPVLTSTALVPSVVLSDLVSDSEIWSLASELAPTWNVLPV